MDSLIPWLPALTALAIIGGAIIGGIYLLRSGRNSDTRARREPLPPTWPEMWDRQNKQEEKNAALSRIIVAMIDQWPVSAAPPDIPEADLKILEETLPTSWFRKGKPRSRPATS